MCQYLYRTGGQLVWVCHRYPQGVLDHEYHKILSEVRKAKIWDWRQMMREPTVYVRGRVWHPDHKHRAHDWHRVVMNTEREAPGATTRCVSRLSLIFKSGDSRLATSTFLTTALELQITKVPRPTNKRKEVPGNGTRWTSIAVKPNYEPLGTVSVARAVIMVFKNTVTVEELDGNRVLAFGASRISRAVGNSSGAFTSTFVVAVRHRA
jgi:hypothetical protein